MRRGRRGESRMKWEMRWEKTRRPATSSTCSSFLLLFWGKSWLCFLMLVLDQNSWMYRSFSLDTQLCLLSHRDPTSLNQDDDLSSSSHTNRIDRDEGVTWRKRPDADFRARSFTLLFSLLILSFHSVTQLSFRFQPLVTTNQHFNPLLLITKTRDQKIVSWQCYESSRILISSLSLPHSHSLTHSLHLFSLPVKLIVVEIVSAKDHLSLSHFSSLNHFLPFHIFFQVNEQTAH